VLERAIVYFLLIGEHIGDVSPADYKHLSLIVSACLTIGP